MTRVLTENVMTFAEASKSLPGRPAMPTVWRWAMYGCRGIHLQYTRVGRKPVTSREALQRFFDRLNEQDKKRRTGRLHKRPIAPRKRLPANEADAIDAEQEAEEAGI